MEMERRLAGLIGLLLLLLAACNGRPTPLTGDAGLDRGDPNIGGGVGIILPDETPGLLPQPTSDVAPRATASISAENTAEVVMPTSPAVATSSIVAASPTVAPDPSPSAEPVEATAVAELRPTEQSAEPTAELEPVDVTDPALAAPADRPTTHTVAAGENLYRIGLQYGISYVALAEYNGITNFDQIAVGQELQIPPAEDEAAGAEAVEPLPEATVTPTATPTPAAAPEATPEPPAEPEPEATISATPSAGQTHEVKPGENLYRISQQYGISWVLIAEANGLISPNQITVGQVLKIPTDVPGPAPQITHQVRAGESLFRIALQYGVALSAMVEANSLQAPYAIYPGQILVIPGQGE